MALLVPDEGEEKLLRDVFGADALVDLELRLFKSDTTPAEGDGIATYTEADFTGYAAVPLATAVTSPSQWVITTLAGVTTAQYARQGFASTADQAEQLVYGYLVVDPAAGKLLWAERFSDGPYAVDFDADVIYVTPKITLE